MFLECRTSQSTPKSGEVDLQGGVAYLGVWRSEYRDMVASFAVVRAHRLISTLRDETGERE